MDAYSSTPIHTELCLDQPQGREADPENSKQKILASGCWDRRQGREEKHRQMQITGKSKLLGWVVSKVLNNNSVAIQLVACVH